MFQKNDIVEFGRTNGEKTRGRVVRVNAKTLTVAQLEPRGVQRTRAVGTKWRVPFALVTPVGEATPRRAEAVILREMRRVESQLSPENLHWDGERPRAEARAAARRLKARWRELVGELGREPTFGELL